MKALTLVEYAIGTISRSYAAKHLPLDQITDADLEAIECLASKNQDRSKQAEAYAAEVLSKLQVNA
jgi:hypothetical protein